MLYAAKLVSMVFCLSTMTFLTGCVTRPNSNILIDNTNHNVVFGTTALARSVELTDIYRDRKKEKLRSSMVIKNKEDKARILQYRFNWYDIQGLELDNKNIMWLKIDLAPGGSILLKGVAPTPDAHDFRVSLREIE